jgi:acetyl esterase/lipase
MSLQNVLLSALLRWQRNASLQLTAEHRLKRARKFMAAERGRVKPSIAVRKDSIAGVAVEWVVPKSRLEDPQTPLCLYFHGGGFVMGGPNSHRDMAACLAEKAGIRMLMVDYRLAPEHPFPAALDDCLAVYQALLAQGIPTHGLLLGGDSAGGNLALATLQTVRDRKLPLPLAFFLFSPWLDLANRAPSFASNAASDVMLSAQILNDAALLYTHGTAVSDPRLSPILGDMAGLPPCYMVVSQTEVLRDDALGLHRKLVDQGGHSTCVEWPDTPHAFPVLARLLPEARKALAQTAAFIAQQLAAAPRSAP